MPKQARWKSLQAAAKQPTIGKTQRYRDLRAGVQSHHLADGQDEIAQIAHAYHAWRGGKDTGKYADMPGFCKSASFEEIRKHSHVLTPGRYVGAEAVEDDGEPFEEKMRRLSTTLDEQFTESARLEQTIRGNLRHLR